MHTKVNISFSFHALHQRNNTYQPSADNFVILHCCKEKRYREKRMMLWFYHFTPLPSHKIAWWVNNHGFRHGRRNNICLIEGIIPLSLFMFRGVSCAGVALRRAKSAARWIKDVCHCVGWWSSAVGWHKLPGRAWCHQNRCAGGSVKDWAWVILSWLKRWKRCGGYFDRLVSAHTSFVCFAKIKRADPGRSSALPNLSTPIPSCYVHCCIYAVNRPAFTSQGAVEHFRRLTGRFLSSILLFPFSNSIILVSSYHLDFILCPSRN